MVSCEDEFFKYPPEKVATRPSLTIPESNSLFWKRFLFLFIIFLFRSNPYRLVVTLHFTCRQDSAELFHPPLDWIWILDIMFWILINIQNICQLWKDSSRSQKMSACLNIATPQQGVRRLNMESEWWGEWGVLMTGEW